MAICFNEDAVAAEPVGAGAQRQRLLTTARVKDTSVLLDRLTLAPGGGVDLAVAPTSLAWCQVLSGDVALAGAGRLTQDHVVFLPSGFAGRLTSQAGAALLYAEVPQAARFDRAAANPPALRIVDWTREPVLDSQHDARRRIYLVTPKLFGTKAIKGEMIIYPPGTNSANHHHEGAEHFMYILSGRGTAWASERPFPVRAGDVVWYPDRERHYLKSDDDSEMRFVEFFVPAEFATIWVNPAEVCTWLPTGRDIRGDKPAREIAAHSSAEVLSPADV
jgi:quercetin dioxygenase-like cupin family protein